MKKLFIFILTSLLLVSCGIQKSPQTPNTPKNTPKTQIEKTTKITTSILPLASLVKTIGREKIEVKNIVGAGKSPHGFDLKTSHIVDLEDAEGVVMIGMDHIDGFLDKNLNDKNVLTVSDGIKLLEMGEHEHEHEDEHDDEHEEDEDSERDPEINSGGHFSEGQSEDKHTEDEHEHGAHEKDPHIWNSPENAKIIARKIRDFLSRLQPENAETFEKNYTDFITKIDALKNDFVSKTTGKDENYFIVFHDAHNYLLRDLGINEDKKLVFRKSVLNEPNSKDMQELLDEIQLHNVKVAFVEPQFKNSNFEKLAKKYNIKTYILDPLGTDESVDGYLKNLKNNLESLEKIFE